MKLFVKKNINNIILISFIIIINIILIIIYLQISTSTKTSNTKKIEKMILVDISDCKLYIIENKKCIEEYKISAGKYTTPSPLGFFKIIDKGLWGDGFGGYWLGLNVPWGKYGIHGTTSPDSIGWYASHGCIRMNSNDIKKIYNKIPIGTKVLIINGTDTYFNNGLQTLKLKSQGGNVLYIQKLMSKLGYYNGTKNGIITEYFLKSLNKFQKDKNIKVRNFIGKEEYEKLGINLND